jgi:hypothetical protein
MPRKVLFAAVLVALAAAPLTACGGSGASGATVPSLAGSGSGGTQGGGSRAAALHAAAQCIRQHGIPGYADPVLTPSGAVYSDSRSFENAPQSTLDALQQACRTLLAQAQLNPESEPPAPPQFVQAGVLAAECFRAHGMPNVRDPNAQSLYTPGHGFGLSADEVPPGGKASPIFQRAARACEAQISAELQASTLASLGNDG